jgi:hypothetical protein
VYYCTTVVSVLANAPQTLPRANGETPYCCKRFCNNLICCRRHFDLSIVSRTHYTALLAEKDGDAPISMSNFVDDERFDGMYLNVADTAHGIEPLLDTVFSFCKSLFVSLTECD